MRCIIYCRISSAIQQDGISLNAQLESCMNTARTMGHINPTVIQEVGTARGNIPPLLDVLSNKKGIIVIFYSVDRFSRNIQKGNELIDRMIKNGQTLIFIRENIILKNDENYNNYRNSLNLALSHAEVESNAISDRVKLAFLQYKNQGFHVGTVPFGKSTISDSIHINRKRLVNNTREQKIIEFIKGCCTEGFSVAEINNILKQLAPIAESDPIVVEIEEKQISHLISPLNYSTIADFLNDYEVPYRNNKKWTASIVSRIYHNNISNFSMTNINNVIDSMDEDESDKKYSDQSSSSTRITLHNPNIVPRRTRNSENRRNRESKSGKDEYDMEIETSKKPRK